jgi:hypothetical protein
VRKYSVVSLEPFVLWRECIDEERVMLFVSVLVLMLVMALLKWEKMTMMKEGHLCENREVCDLSH